MDNIIITALLTGLNGFLFSGGPIFVVIAVIFMLTGKDLLWR